MVEDVEGLKADDEGEALTDGEAAAECGVQVKVAGSTDGVAAEIAESAGGVLGECRFVQIGEVASRLLSDFDTGIDSVRIDQVRAIKADAGERVVDARGDIVRDSAGNADERGDLPVVGQRAGPALKAGEVAGRNEGRVEDVANVEAAGRAIKPTVGGVHKGWCGDVARRVADADAV